MQHPRETTRLYGHEAPLAKLTELHAKDKLPQGLILAGPRGTGKATLAYHFIRQLLAGENEAAARRITAGSHADLLVIEPEFDAKKGEYNAEIKAEAAREIGAFFSMTPAESKYRAVLIDSADALTQTAANAILKELEEPPEAALLILIAHQPDLLLPTIRSRCHFLRLAPLTPDACDDAMRQLLPDASSKERAFLAQVTDGAPGLAAEYTEREAAAIYADIIEIIKDLPALPHSKIHALSERVSRSKPHENWRIFTRLMLFLLGRAAKLAAGQTIESISEEEGAALNNMVRLRPAPYWAEKWQSCADEFLVAQRLHLDYKQVMIAFFHTIHAEQGFSSKMSAA